MGIAGIYERLRGQDTELSVFLIAAWWQAAAGQQIGDILCHTEMWPNENKCDCALNQVEIRKTNET